MAELYGSMREMTIDPRLILIGVGLLLAVIVLVKFGKAIARMLLVAGILAVLLVLATALLNQATATRQVATIAAGTTFSTAILAVLLLASVGAGGYFGIRWKLAERRQLPRSERRRRLAQPEREERESLYYYEDDDAGIVDVYELDLSQWGW